MKKRHQQNMARACRNKGEEYNNAQRGSHNEPTTRGENAQISKPVVRARPRTEARPRASTRPRPTETRSQGLKGLKGPADCAERLNPPTTACGESVFEMMRLKLAWPKSARIGFYEPRAFRKPLVLFLFLGHQNPSKIISKIRIKL